MDIIAQNKRYLPHEITTKINSVKLYRESRDIDFVCTVLLNLKYGDENIFFETEDGLFTLSFSLDFEKRAVCTSF